MPVYDYRCGACGRVSSLFFRSLSMSSQPSCPACGSGDLTRLVSRFAVLKGDTRRARDFDVERGLSGLDERDPRNISRWARETGKQYDDELGSNLREMADKMDAGDTPSELYDPAHYFSYAARHHSEELTKSTSEEGPPSLEDQMGRPELKGIGHEP